MEASISLSWRQPHVSLHPAKQAQITAETAETIALATRGFKSILMIFIFVSVELIVVKYLNARPKRQ